MARDGLNETTITTPRGRLASSFWADAAVAACLALVLCAIYAIDARMSSRVPTGLRARSLNRRRPSRPSRRHRRFFRLAR